MRYTKYISLLFVIGELASAGSKGNAPVIKATTPRPARGVFVREVGTLAFPLPNGTNVAQ
jgi:hypothetical protein